MGSIYTVDVEDIKREIKKLADDMYHGYLMPKGTEWAEHKPEGYPTAATIKKNFGLRWRDIADSIGVKLQVGGATKTKDDVREKVTLEQLKESMRPRKTPLIKPRREPEFNNPDFFRWRHEPHKRG